MSEGAGKNFLESFPNKEEWPDLEDDRDTSIVPTTALTKKDASIQGAILAENWELEIDVAWSNRARKPGESIHGSVAASDASKILGVNKLGESPHKTLRGLMRRSQYLSARWSFDENTIIRILNEDRPGM
jgi:hypothetical protein